MNSKAFKTGLKTLAAASVVASTLVSTPSFAGKLSLGHTTWVGYGTLYLARDLGFFEEQGLELELQTIEEASMYMAAAASGRLSGSASTIDEILKYRPQFCFKAVAALDESFGGDGVLVNDSIKSIQDLKGQRVGVNEGSVSQFWLSYLLSQQQMDMSDLQIENMTADDAASAFIAGRIPAAVTWEPHLSMVRSHDTGGKVLVDSSSTPGVIVDVVALNCDVIENQPEDVKALVKGLYKAVEYTKENPEKAYEIMAKGVGGYLSDPAELAAAAQSVRFYNSPMSKQLLGTDDSRGDIADIIELANKTWSKLQGKTYDVKYRDLVDTRFVTAE
ncbi:ABC transporter substrate-binding protein [Marinobacterium sp. YM272]|uniref:ABC transporter substrate-binding protein n=1 Tax=Marinobacterium sp. YM272 TaxID=3421654 RepID=UPI003D7F2156